MRRATLPARPDWRTRLDHIGLSWHSPTPEHPVEYWGETGHYVFTPAEIARLEAATSELTALLFDICEHIVARRDFARLGLPPGLWDRVARSWHDDDPTLYMRYDLAYDGRDIKLLEVNAQTPTSLVEAGVAQWHWLEDHLRLGHLPGGTDQWNNIHEALIAQLRHLRAERSVTHLHLASAESDEDFGTVQYLRDLATQAEMSTTFLWVRDIGTRRGETRYLDLGDAPIDTLFWLWPYEFAWEDASAHTLTTTTTRLMEPLWKTMLSSKGVLALLWERHAGHELLLPATLGRGTQRGPVARKPLFSREGQNVELTGPHADRRDGAYADLPVVEQAYVELPRFTAEDGTERYPVLGAWIAGQDPCGLGIREGRARITDNRSTFAPHVIEPG